MDTTHNIRILKLLMRILETNAQHNQTSVSIGFQNESKMKSEINRKKNNYK